jgi:hypothetical protein
LPKLQTHPKRELTAGGIFVFSICYFEFPEPPDFILVQLWEPNMWELLHYPLFVLVASFVLQCLAAYAGCLLRARERSGSADPSGDIDIILGAALTLLALTIGFTLSMGVNRYDLRKNYEEAEANAIGTEYVRADLLSSDRANKIRALLARYIDRRIQFYITTEQPEIGQIDAGTALLQNQLWAVASRAGHDQPTPVTALVVSGMNDVLNSQGYTQAAWLNRLPVETILLMVLIAIGCNVILGYRTGRRSITLLILPLIASISFYLISDIDSPRRGIIRVIPQNLILQSQAMKPAG